MVARDRRMIVTDEPTVITKLLLDAIIVDDQDCGHLANSASSN